MSKHELSQSDREFRAAFEAGAYAPADFSHRAHVRLAYVYLAGWNVDTALERMRAALVGFLSHHDIPASKYHETLTRAWVLAVDHFMHRTPDCCSPTPRARSSSSRIWIRSRATRPELRRSAG